MNKDVLKICIGYDPVESVAWHTLVHSIMLRSTIPVAIIPINLQNLKKIYNRELDQRQSNSFSFTRFLTPYLCAYDGYALFMDCDMMLRVDIAEILSVIEEQPDKAVYVVKHDYTPKDEIKYLGTVQHNYPRKNWSSVVLWNCGHPSNRHVTADFVNTASPSELHRFLWLNDDEIGSLDVRWNWLVGEYEKPPSDVKNVHWTVGGPYFNEYNTVDFSEDWFLERDEMMYCKQRLESEIPKKSLLIK